MSSDDRVAIRFIGANPDLQPGLARIAAAYPDRFDEVAPVTVRFVPGGTAGLSIEGDTVTYARRCDAFRALGIAMGGLLADGRIPQRAETSAFARVAVMLDVSRNAVMRTEALESFLVRLALMGVNELWLYMEDTYQVPGQPLFGYFRGAYSADELRHIDDMAADLGIEVVPCIQTLGHLAQVLQWRPYHGLQDVTGVMLADDPDTYALIRRMISAATAPFRSNRVHLGMDEAHGMATGTYLRRHGYASAFDVFTRHLDRVLGICDDLGVRPMIWSDMYFRIGSARNDYYDREATIPPSVADRIPADVPLVYWDYEHTDQDFYQEWIDRHRALGSDPVFAGGAWTWGRFWAQLPEAISRTRSAMDAARNRALADVTMTVWGDDGAECDLFSALPVIQAFADSAYEGDSENSHLAANFRGSCDGTLDTWLAASEIDQPPGPSPTMWPTNPGKWLLWHDPILGHYDADIADLGGTVAPPAGDEARGGQASDGEPETPHGADTGAINTLVTHYQAVAERLRHAATAPGDSRLAFPADIAAALALKVELHTVVKPRYRAGDTAGIRDVADRLLPQLATAVRALWATHRRTWRDTNKPFGWEVIERRYGGLLARLDTLSGLLDAWLADPSGRIEEFEVSAERMLRTDHVPTGIMNYRRAASPSIEG